MMADESAELLHQFNRHRSEAAFRALVRCHSPLVYATALRRLSGDREAARDVMQEVFTLLARKATGLQVASLGGWLHRQTCRRASNHRRSEQRRKQRELASVQAMADSHSSAADHEAISGEIDEALLALPSSDRELLVQRFFGGQDFRAVGSSLGISEEAARKRVARALERLAAMLQRRGAVTAAGTLGPAMSAMGSTPVPEALVAQISSQAVSALPAAGWLTVAELVRPFLAGVALVCLTASGLLVLQARKTSPPPPAPASAATAPRSPGLTALLRSAEEGSMEDLIAEIKRTRSGPGHALTSLRLGAILDRIPLDRVPDFMELAGKKLTVDDRSACYKPLFTRWLESDPDAALDLLLTGRHSEHVDEGTSTYLLGNLFSEWAEKDLQKAEAWLARNWAHEGLDRFAYGGPSRDSFAMEVADTYMWRQSGKAAVDYIISLPSREAQEQCLEGLAGTRPYASAWMNVGADRLTELYRALANFPDARLAAVTKQQLWESLNRTEPDKAAQMIEALGPRERFEASLAKTGIYSQLKSITKGLGHARTLHSEEVDNSQAGPADSLAQGLAAGIPRQEVLTAIGTALLQKPELTAATVAWLEAYRDEIPMDELLIDRIGEFEAQDEMTTLRLAARLGDPGQRLQLSRAVFRRALASSNRLAPKNILDSPDLPADLRAEFQKLNEPQP
ncbi:RNA polymerase sigma factor [Luteolibacter sp. Populi]|uniref:RNA polymerase sigma factor n=1 Tax=Luteolibacter sp. Populi TaxID=3230487 RepID=UPI003467BBBB